MIFHSLDEEKKEYWCRYLYNVVSSRMYEELKSRGTIVEGTNYHESDAIENDGYMKCEFGVHGPCAYYKIMVAANKVAETVGLVVSNYETGMVLYADAIKLDDFDECQDRFFDAISNSAELVTGGFLKGSVQSKC